MGSRSAGPVYCPMKQWENFSNSGRRSTICLHPLLEKPSFVGYPSTDEIRWKLTGDGKFSTTYQPMTCFFMAMENCPYGELLWRSRAPSRIRFLMWVALKGRCLTADNLAKRNWQHDVLCPLYQQENEDCHLMFVTL